MCLSDMEKTEGGREGRKKKGEREGGREGRKEGERERGVRGEREEEGRIRGSAYFSVNENTTASNKQASVMQT